jgi:UDPglucose 6-dehydrogenase
LEQTVSMTAPPGPADTLKTGDYSYQLSLDAAKLPDMTLTRKDMETTSRIVSSREQSQDGSPVKGKTFALWGLSFKPQTDDIREAPALTIIEQLLKLGADVQAYDPEAVEPVRRIFGKKVRYARTNYDALRDADALILVTEWNVFRNPDFEKIRSLLKYPVIFDGRNQYNPVEMRELGFLYFGIGRRS